MSRFFCLLTALMFGMVPLAHAQSASATGSNATIDQSTNDTDVTQSSSASSTTTQNQTINGSQVNNTYINPDRSQSSITSRGGSSDLLHSDNRSIRGDGDRDGRNSQQYGRYDGPYNGNYDRSDQILGGGLRRDESRDPTIIRPSEQAERAYDASDRLNESNRAATGTPFASRTSGVGSTNNNANPLAAQRAAATGDDGSVSRRMTGPTGGVQFAPAAAQTVMPVTGVPHGYPVSNAPAYDINNVPRSGPGYGRYSDVDRNR